MDIAEAEAIVRAVPAWHHDFEIFPDVRTNGSYDPSSMWQHLQLPDDLTGKRVLDIGASDGFFSMNLARHGADVTSVDYRRKDVHGFAAMEQITNLKFKYQQANIYELRQADIGTFDIVLFLGVLYHLPDMVRALAIVRDLCDGVLFLETDAEPDLVPGIACARYYEADTLANDLTNFWAPNKECVFAMLRDVGFSSVRHEMSGRRLLLEARTEPRTYKMALGYGKVPLTS